MRKFTNNNKKIKYFLKSLYNNNFDINKILKEMECDLYELLEWIRDTPNLQNELKSMDVAMSFYFRFLCYNRSIMGSSSKTVDYNFAKLAIEKLLKTSEDNQDETQEETIFTAIIPNEKNEEMEIKI